MITDRINHEVITTFNAERTGDNIKHYREQKGWTQTDLAAKIGKTESSVRKYEAGQTDIPLPVIADLSNALDVIPSWLISFKMQERMNAKETNYTDEYRNMLYREGLL